MKTIWLVLGTFVYCLYANLVVEDERKMATFVRRGLQEQGFHVDICANGNDAYMMETTREYDLIVLDIMLPGRDGLSILRSLQEKKHSVSVILLTARSELNERLDGLNFGDDDYPTKPFYIEELIARIYVVFRRGGDRQLSVLRVEDLTLNLLTREFSLLEHLDWY